jgi:hypothetical protein
MTATLERPVVTSGWERWLPLGGPAYALLLVVAAAAFPMPPGGDVTAAAHPGWLALHTGPVIAQGLLRMLASLAFGVLAVGAAGACARRTGPGVLPALALIGGALSCVLMIVAQATSVAAALFIRDGGSADPTRAIGALQAACLDASSLPAALLFLAVGVVSFQRELMPRWLATVTLAGVPIAVVDSASYQGGPLEPVALVGLVYFLAWSLLAGVQLTRPTAGERQHETDLPV